MTASSYTSVNEGAARPSGGWGCPPEPASEEHLAQRAVHHRGLVRSWAWMCDQRHNATLTSQTIHTSIAASKPGSHPRLATPPIARCTSGRGGAEFRRVNVWFTSLVTAIWADAKALPAPSRWHGKRAHFGCTPSGNARVVPQGLRAKVAHGATEVALWLCALRVPIESAMSSEDLAPSAGLQLPPKAKR